MVALAVPEQIAGAPLRTVRPLMLREIYANPEKEVVRMRRSGRLVRIAPGTYTAKPDTIPPDTAWFPDFEEAAMAYATGQYGPRIPVLFGIGAARFHHAIPRAIAVTVIAVPEPHQAVTLANGGKVIFTTTDVNKLDARRERGELGTFLVTTKEQTLIDLIARPQLGGLPGEATAAAQALIPKVDQDRLDELLTTRPHTIQKKVAKVMR
ncbi:MAG: type IV toxin-antitoxin system AbiEi family antitoxin [Tessaracoccus sp.]